MAGNPYHVKKGKREGGRFTSQTGQTGGQDLDKAIEKHVSLRKRLQTRIAARKQKEAVEGKHFPNAKTTPGGLTEAPGAVLHRNEDRLAKAARKGAGLPESHEDSQSDDIRMVKGSGGIGSKAGPGGKPNFRIAPPKPQGEQPRYRIMSPEQLKAHTAEVNARNKAKLAERELGKRVRDSAEGLNPKDPSADSVKTQMQESDGIAHWQRHQDEYVETDDFGKRRFNAQRLAKDLKSMGFTDEKAIMKVIGHAAMHAWDKRKGK